MIKSILNKCFSIAAFLIQATLLLQATDTHAQYTILNNNKIRMGNGNENSVNASGNLQQPFYYNSQQNAWRKLTYSVYPLDNAYAIGGDKTSEWNLNGTILQNPTITGQTANTSGFITTNGDNGYGTIVSKGTINIGGSELEIENTYTLPENSAYVVVKVKIRNVSSAPVENVRMWIGTRDDWVGNTDGPTKKRGNLTDQFVQLTDPSTRAAALKIFTGAEGVLFYTNSNRGNTIVNSCCSWSNIVNQNPATSTVDVTNDGSYGFYVRMNDLAVGASDEFSWYYAAGELADLDAIIREVAVASGTFTNLTSGAGTFKATSGAAATGYWMVVPRGSIPPTAAQIKAGTSYGTVTPTATGVEPMPPNVEVSFNMTGLAPATEYDFYFVTEDETPAFTDVITAPLTTHAFPSMETIADVTGCQDRITAPERIAVNDAETAAASLTLSATSSNTTLIPDANIIFGGEGGLRTISMTPAAGQYGTSVISVTVTDGDGDIATEFFTVNIAFNDTGLPVVADGKFYESATPVNLLELVTGDGLLWYAAETGGTGSAVTSTPVTTVGTQEFWVTQTIGVCESPRAKITVTLDATKIAGNAAPKTVPYQFSSLVDDQITIAGSDNIPAAKVFIGNGFASGDELICATAMPEGVTNIFNTSTGELMFTGNASAAAWQTVFRNVRFRTTSTDTDDRVIHFSLGSAKDHAATIQRNTGDAVTLSKSSIDEGMATESPVGTFAVNGVDAGLTFTYEFIPGTGDEDNLSLAILNDGLKTAVVPDYESQTRFNIRVRVTDNFNKSYEQTFSVTVNNLNDTKPAIAASQPLNLDENSSAGLIATAMEATDADGTTNFAWTIVGGNTKTAFTIDPSTGEIAVVDDASLDYEVLSTYTLTVMVNDGLNDSEPTEVVINVNNLNDSRPVITAGQRFNLDENSEDGTSVCYVEATDPDGVTTFEGWTIIEGNIGAAFTIDPSTGEITVADVSALDHETRASYTLLISVSDGINTSEHKAVTIHLNNLNDNLPSDILLSNDRFSESESSGTSIGTFSTVDPDMESSQSYSLVPGAGDVDNSKFAIDGDQLVTAATFDYDFEKVLTIRVRMTDSRSDSYEKIFTITVEADKDIQLAIPTAFSPNGDQVNDTWEIDRLLSYPESVVKVFNNDGMEVFSNTGYTAQWDGTHKGRQQAFGTYYYIVRLNDGSGKTFKGTVMIIK